MSAGAFYLFRTPESVDSLGPGMLAFLRQSVVERGAQFVKAGDYKNPRSLDQSALFHALCADVAKAWNAKYPDKPTTPEAVKRDAKVLYGVKVVEYSPLTDKQVARIESTSAYSKRQLSDLITATLAWAADNGIPIPDPRHEA